MALCTVYRSEKKPETYLYLAAGTSFDDLPEGLRKVFGAPVFVMSLKLDPGRRLARVSAAEVLESLRDPGYFLQLPPELPVEEEISRRFS